jgi:hypothetical protein
VPQLPAELRAVFGGGRSEDGRVRHPVDDHCQAERDDVAPRWSSCVHSASVVSGNPSCHPTGHGRSVATDETPGSAKHDRLHVLGEEVQRAALRPIPGRDTHPATLDTVGTIKNPASSTNK